MRAVVRRRPRIVSPAAWLQWGSASARQLLPTEPHMAEVTTTAKKIIANVEKVIVGKRQQIILSLVSWFSEGHILLEDVPGVAKTMLARALAASVGCAFKRIQCTPDLLADRRDRRFGLQSEDNGVRISPRPDLRSDRAGRRNQSHHAAHAGGPVGGDGRGPRDRRWPDYGHCRRRFS